MLRRRGGLLVVLTLGIALIVSVSARAVPTQSLDGEFIDVPDFMPQVTQTTTCVDHPDGSQSFEYTIVPQAGANPTVFHARGPYPGPYTFTVTGTLGPPGPVPGAPEAGDFYRLIPELSGDFTIQSGSTTVSGSVFLDPSAPTVVNGSNHWALGFCNGATDWDGFIQTTYVLWEATIDDGAGTLDDQGGVVGSFVIGTAFGSPLKIYFVSVPESLDSDGDGIPDDIDSDGGTGSNPPGFSDDTGAAVATTGTVTGGSVTVEDVADPQGVRITAGSEGATLSVCGSYGLDVPSDGSLTLTCGSVAVEDVAGGSVAVTVPGGAVVTFPTGTSGTVDTAANGAVVVTGIGGSGVTLTVDGVVADLGSGGSWAVIKGGAGNDSLKGTAGNDLIIGYGGNDQIDGRGGDDTINAGAGNNAVKGGDGADAITAGAGNDALDGGAGTDTARPAAARTASRTAKRSDRFAPGPDAY